MGKRPASQAVSLARHRRGALILALAANTCTATAIPSACQPSWLDTGSNSWQLTAATFVALMSIPGLALLYGGLVPKKWVVNTMFMAFSGFALVLVVWVLWAYKMGFGSPLGGGSADKYNYTYGGNFFKNFFYNFVGHPETSLRGSSEGTQASLPIGTALPLSQATTSLFYFQFVFAAITPLLFLGSVLGRIKIRVWMIFVPLWTTFVYSVNAMLIWGGGYWAHKGAVDYSGGYVIHLAAGTSGFVAAWMIGPRLARDRQRFLPHSLPLVSIGAGIVWLGWNGFNGGDPYFASANASTAVVNTNIATVSALLVWVLCDMYLGKEKKPTFLGAVNGMIVGLVCITPGAGYVSGGGAMLEAAIASVIVWLAWTYLQPIVIAQGRRCDGRGLHPRPRRTARRLAGRHLRRPERGGVPEDHERHPVRRHRLALRQQTSVLPAGLGGAHHHRLGRARHVYHPQGDQPVHVLAHER